MKVLGQLACLASILWPPKTEPRLPIYCWPCEDKVFVASTASDIATGHFCAIAGDPGASLDHGQAPQQGKPL
ncbi:MAG: hypothetical protein JNL10_03170 [Verrucomicrobiales bacterium]|nr:hypothetical protein [Verrucomicrobiales bacterium]